MNSFISGIRDSLSAQARPSVRVFAVAAGILLLALPLFAQQNLARISGGVTDPSGAVVPGASVTVTNVATGTVRHLTTDQAGQYNAPGLIPGTYTVRVTATGFKASVRQGILLETGKDVLIDVQLSPGTVTQSVVVTAAPPLINTTSATLGGTLSNTQINNLPLIGRNYVNLVALRPGAAQAPGGGGWTLSSNGLRVDSQNWIVDGMDNNETFLNQQVINSQSPAGDAATILPIDAISEFNVIENPKAEYGYSSGAVVNVGIKSGTNKVHGTAYAFGRSGSWDARNYFNNGKQNPLGLEQWGGTIGGPIIKNKLFYFGGFEEQRYTLGIPLPVVLPSTNPSANPVVGIPAATAELQNYCTSNPSSAPFCNGSTFVPNALSEKLLPLWGSTTNASGNVTLNNLTSNSNSNNVLGKVNYNVNSHNTLSAFYFLGNMNSVAEDFPVVQPQFLTKIHQRGQTATGAWTWMPNAAWVNEARFGFIRWNQPVGTVDQNTPATSFGINTGVTNPLAQGMPLIFVGGLGGGAALGSGLGGNIDWPHYFGPDTNFDFTDNISYLHGNHTFKWGGEIRFAMMNETPLAYAKGNVNFFGGGAIPNVSTPLEDFLAGTPTFGLLSVGNTVRKYHSSYFALFMQDDWRVTHRVTLNLGLRWGYWSPLKETNDLMGNWTPARGFFAAGGSQGGTVYNTSVKNFAPRFGLAWDVFGNGKTVVRAGSGVYYDTTPASSFLFNVVNLVNFPTAGIGQDPTGAYFVDPATGAATQRYPNGIQSGTLFFPFLNWSSAGPVFPIHPVACGDGNTPISSGPDSLLGIPAVPCNIFAVAQNFQTPYSVDWTFGIEQALTSHLSFDVSYVGNHGANLSSVLDANQINPAASGESGLPGSTCYIQNGPDSAHCEANTSRPYGTKYPDIGIVNMLGNAFRSNYNSLQTTLSARNFHRMTFVLGYTYGHCLDQMSFSHFPVTPQNSMNPGAEYGSCDIDVRHRLTLAFTYNLPGMRSPGQILQGWTVNAIVTVQSAMPWASFDTGNDISRTGELMDRWDFFGNTSDFSGHGHTSIPYCGAGDFSNASSISCTQTTTAGTVSLSSQQASADAAACYAAAAKVPNGPFAGDTGLQSLDSYGCFAEGSSVLVPPATGTFGFSGRNIFRGSGYKNLDFSIFKSFKFGERASAEFRAEFFNILNHPNFANPYGSITAWGPGFSSDPSAPSNYGCGCRTPDVAQTDPVLGSGGPRAMQLGLKFIF